MTVGPEGKAAETEQAVRRELRSVFVTRLTCQVRLSRKLTAPLRCFVTQLTAITICLVGFRFPLLAAKSSKIYVLAQVGEKGSVS